MTLLDVIAKTAGSTSSKRRALEREAARLDDQVRADDLIAKRALRDRKVQKRNVYWNFVANLESCLLKS